MTAPTLTAAQVQKAVPNAKNITEIGKGGQKLVFAADLDGYRCVLKFMSPDLDFASLDPSETGLDAVTARAQREVETMQQCNCPYLVKTGNLPMTNVMIDNQPYILFSEELIDGADLRTMLKTGVLPIAEIIDLGQHITIAVSALWAQHKIHRDIKPGNVMRRNADRAFILLDMGLVFDLDDESLSISPVGTKIYFAPEQMDFANRRSVMDFRSDLFSLGIVMYEMATGHHPFMTPDVRNSMDVLFNIKNLTPALPSKFRPEIPAPLDTFIMRLLAKRPALRYRKIDMVLQTLEQMKGGR